MLYALTFGPLSQIRDGNYFLRSAQWCHEVIEVISGYTSVSPFTNMV